MARDTTPRPDFSARLSFWLLAAFLVVLWVAGGASRADVFGQTVTRFFAWTFLIVFTLISPSFDWHRVRPIAIVLGLAMLLVLLQLIPLPPSIWTALPGRELLVRAAEVIEQPQPWRPLSISPAATANALSSLVVPAAVLVFGANLTRDQHWRICELVLGLIFAGCILALLQVSGAQFGNPLLNYVEGSVSGNFANRNHFALFVALGCLIAPVWGFRRERTTRWKGIAAIALLPLFLLVILAVGSRAGLLLGGVAIVAGLAIVRTKLLQEMRSMPRWAAVVIASGAVLALMSVVILSLALGRAIAVDRALDTQVVDDLRSRALPYVLHAIVQYFPVGTGFGTFDAAYRIGEPDALLQSVYFNHVHNDWLEIVLDGGAAGVALLLGGVGWGVFAALRAWQSAREAAVLARMASAALVLIMLAGVLDYPARTPMIMALIVMAAIWMNGASHPASGSSRVEEGRP